MGGSGVNLVLVARPRRSLGDLHTLAAMVERIDPGIRVFVSPDQRQRGFWLKTWTRPTLVVSCMTPRHFKLPHGAVLGGRRLPKSTEYTLLGHQGLPIPDWTLLREGDPPGIEGLGAYVVSKPNVGKQGADVVVRRADKMRWIRPKTKVARGFAEAYGRPELIAQRFIYTGRWPVSYRVVTFAGRAVLGLKVSASESRAPLEDKADFGAGGRSIVSSSGGCRMALCDDPEILAFAERAHRAFPNHPLLGFDILREQPSGKLFVCEANTSGNVWVFAGEQGEQLEEAGLDLKGQLGAFETIAASLAALAVERAR